jgi:hypothetical protein
MKTTPKRKAQRVSKQVQDEDQDMFEDQEATPTAASVSKTHEFDAPKFKDFASNEPDISVNDDGWFGKSALPDTNHPDKRVVSPQDPTLRPRNLLAEAASPSILLPVAKHVMVLRKRSSGVAKKTARSKHNTIGGMTIPKPFNLVTAAKKTLRSAAQEPRSPFVPLAIKLQGFEKQVADRKPRV